VEHADNANIMETAATPAIDNKFFILQPPR
jgi:hypothetical protein